MAENSKIEWTDHTFNPWRGCTKVAAGCANCYADAQAKRNPGTLGIWGDHGTRVVASEDMWRQPLKWNREAACYDTCDCHQGMISKHLHADCCPQAHRPRVFCASMADVFEDWKGKVVDSQGRQLFVHDCEPNPEPHRFVPMREDLMPHERENLANGMFRPLTLDDVRKRFFAQIDETPNLDRLLLTKRPENIPKMWREISQHSCGAVNPNLKAAGVAHYQCKCGAVVNRWYRENVWLGTSIACQADADRNIPELLKCRDLAPVLFLSIEPLVGPVEIPFTNLAKYAEIERTGQVFRQIDWVIVGGESGPNARPIHPDWVRSIRDQCQAAGVAFFFKQWGEYLTFEQVRTREQGKLFSDATRAGEQSYFGARIVPGVQGLKTSTTSEVRPASYAKIGKAAAGRLLDGREWNEMPEVQR